MSKASRVPIEISQPEASIVAQIIRDVGPSVLGHFDGCICSRFSIRNVDFVVSCGSSSARGAVISTKSGDYEKVSDLSPIVDAFQEEMSEICGGELPVTARVNE